MRRRLDPNEGNHMRIVDHADSDIRFRHGGASELVLPCRMH